MVTGSWENVKSIWSTIEPMLNSFIPALIIVPANLLIIYKMQCKCGLDKVIKKNIKYELEVTKICLLLSLLFVILVFPHSAFIIYRLIYIDTGRHKMTQTLFTTIARIISMFRIFLAVFPIADMFVYFLNSKSFCKCAKLQFLNCVRVKVICYCRCNS